MRRKQQYIRLYRTIARLFPPTERNALKELFRESNASKSTPSTRTQNAEMQDLR